MAGIKDVAGRAGVSVNPARLLNDAIENPDKKLEQIGLATNIIVR